MEVSSMAGDSRFRLVAGLLVVPAMVLVLAATQGTHEGSAPLGGMVRFEGTPPAGRAADLSSDPFCAQANQGRTVRVDAPAVGEDGSVANVIVYVKEGPVQRGGPAPADPVVLDQQNCQYTPPAIALRAGQTLLIRNSDQTLHNVHVSPEQNRVINIGQPFAGAEARRTLPIPETGIPVACDIHGWMSGRIGVFDHPHFAVTGADGSFTLGELPPGDYVIEASHETLGVQQQRVTVAPGGQPTVTFTFRGG
jgi:plastocyanin